MDKFKPMLAGTLTDMSKLKYPIIASPKLDGIRCLVISGKVVSRKLKDIPNHYIRQTILSQAPEQMDLDGEIMLKSGDFNNVQSAVMSEDGEPDFVYHVFDAVGGNSYINRIYTLDKHFPTDNIQVLDSVQIDSEFELLEYEKNCLQLGYEGVMIRSLDGPYKFGRSTENEGYLLKMKQFHDAEAKVVGFIEREHNANVATKDALGKTKRSTHKANMIPSNTLGAIQVETESGIPFSVGTGFTDVQRKHIWENRESYIGRFVTYKYQELSSYDVPRFPVFKCFREDM